MRMCSLGTVFIILSAVCPGNVLADEKDDNRAKADEALSLALTKLQSDDTEAALKAADEAVKLAPDDAKAVFVRGRVYAADRKHEEAIRDFDQALKLDPKLATAIDLRGSEYFKLGKIKESIKDFEAYLEARPQDYSKHWRYGISLYYDGRYEDGAKQFKAGEVHFGADVENVFWHYLCNAKKFDMKKAREMMLTIEADQPDTRIPMMEVYKLIRGESTADKVIARATDPKLPERGKREREFYAHLYVALNYEAEGNTEKALEHIKKADALEISHYMWDVGHVHFQKRK